MEKSTLMSKFSVWCVVVGVVFMCCLGAAMPSYAGKVVCSTEWKMGTLGVLTTFEPGDPVALTFIEPGEGGDADICLSSPGLCETLYCEAGVPNDYCINETAIGSCYMYLTGSCAGQPYGIRALVFVSSGPCEVKRID